MEWFSARAGAWGLVLVCTASGTSSWAETPQVLSWIRADVDGDGTADALTLRGDGTLLVEWHGAAPSTLRLAENVLLKRPAEVQFEATAAGRVILARATEVRRGGGMQARALAAVAQGRRLTVAYVGPVGPQGPDGEYTQEVAITSAGLVRYQTAPAVRRCDGEVRLFAERYRDGVGFQPFPELTLPTVNPGPAATGLQRLASAPPEYAGPSLGIYRWVAASAQAHVSRADSLGPPRELDDDSPLSAWAPPQLRGAFVTAQADGAGHSVRALRLTAARGKPLPSRIALVLGGTGSAAATPPVEIELTSALTQWLLFPAGALPPSDCVSLLIRDGAADAAIGDAVLYSEVDGQGGLTNLATVAASSDGSRAEGAARTLLLRARRDAASRQAVLDAVAEVLQKGSGSAEGQRRLDDLLLQLADADVATPGPAAASTATSASLDALLWSAVQRRLQPAAVSDGQAAAFLRQLAGRKHIGPRLLDRIASDARLPGEARGMALVLWAAALPKEAPARLLGLLADASRDAKLAAGWSAAVATAVRCAALDDPAMASLAAPLIERLRAGSDGRDPSAWSATALLLSGLSQALTNCPDLGPRSQLAERIAQAWPSTSAGDEALFVLEYRLLQALERLAAASPTVLSRVAQVAASDADPVLRQLASALHVRLAAPGSDRLRGLRDADVGVRLATLTALLNGSQGANPTGAELPTVRPDELAQIEQSLLRDPWPKVRRTAAEARAAQCRDAAGAMAPRVDALHQALADRDLDVQRRALAGLARCEGPAALDDLSRIAESESAKAGLRGQACALLARHAMAASVLSAAQRERAHRAAGTALVDLLRDPQADDRHAAALAQCLRGFADAGDIADLPVLIESTGAESPSSVRQLAFAAISSICSRPTREPGRGIPDTSKKALADSVAAVFSGSQDLRLQASARRAQQVCK